MPILLDSNQFYAFVKNSNIAKQIEVVEKIMVRSKFISKLKMYNQKGNCTLLTYDQLLSTTYFLRAMHPSVVWTPS